MFCGFGKTDVLQPTLTCDWLCLQPGYYEAGAFGIRHENVLVVRKRNAPHAVSCMRAKQLLPDITIA